MAVRQYLEQIGRPIPNEDFSGLKTLTRLYNVNARGTESSRLKDEVLMPYGTADEEFPAALLTDRKLEQVSIDKSAYVLRLTEVYQEFRPGQKVSVGEDQILRYEDGRTALVRRYVALAYEAEDLAAEIGTVLDGRACSDVKIPKRGVGAEIIETYISSGQLSESTSEGNNGALINKTLVYFNEVPPTPAGFTIVDTDVKGPLGVETYTYRFAKGNGQISYDPSEDNNGKLLRLRIRHLTAPGASNPISTPAGYALVEGPTKQEADGHIIWSAGFAKGDGEIDRDENYDQSEDQGTTGVTKTSIVHLTASSVTTNPITPPAGQVLISLKKVDENGYRVWRALYAKGTGKVAENIAARSDGLREVTWVSLGTRLAPDGEIIRDDWRIADGYKVFTVSVMQTAAGGSDPTAATIAFDRFVPFTYPGRAKTFTATHNGRTFIDVFRSPPVTTDVKARVTVTYTTDDELTVPANYWNPKSWATIVANWVTLSDNPRNLVLALTGYRSVSTTAVEGTAGIIGDGSDLSCMGEIVFGGTTCRVVCTGGPSDPGGTTKTLDMTLEPAFVTKSGTKFYRKTVVEADIPEQEALPV